MDVAQVLSDAGEVQITAGVAAILSLALALFSAWRDRRGALRVDPDAVELLDWRGVQMSALILLAVALFVMVKG